MLFVFNIVVIIFCIVTRLFCTITTFKVLKYDEYFYESNPITRKLLKYRYGKILTVIIGYSSLFILLTLNYTLQILDPRFIWILTIAVSVILPVFIYDFLNDIIYFFRDYRKVKSELEDEV